MNRNHIFLAVSGMGLTLLAMLKLASPAAPGSSIATPVLEPTGVAEPVSGNPTTGRQRVGGWVVGDRMLYRFEIRQASDVGDSIEGSAAQSCQSAVLGHMEQTVLAVSDVGVEFDLAIADMRAEQAGVSTAIAAADRRLKVLQSPDGLVGGYHVEDGCDASLPRMLFLRLHQIPASGASFVSAEDETGMCDFHLEFSGASVSTTQIVRKKTRISLLRPSEVPVSIAIKETSDQIEQEMGCTLRANCHEVLEVDAGGIMVRAVLDLHAECVARDRIDVRDSSAITYGPWRRVDAGQSPSTPPTLDEALQALREIEARGEIGSLAMQRIFSGLVERFVADPAAVQDLVKRLLGGEMSPPQLSTDMAGLLISALADSAMGGGASAPGAIRQLVDELPQGDLLAAVARSSHQLIDLPANVVAPVLLACANRLRRMGPDQMLEGDFELAIGGMLRTVGGQGESSQLGLAVLKERMATEGGVCRFVSALAESRNEALIQQEVGPLVLHSDAAVRMRAMEAIGVCMDYPGVQDVLLRAAESDSEPAVRMAAATALASRQSPVGRSALIRVATTDPEAAVRITAVRLLAQDPDSAARAALRGIALRDGDEGVRREAQNVGGR